MNNYKNVLFDPLVRFAENDRKKHTDAALHHWFARNRGVARRAWPVTYEPTYQYEKLECPPGINATYWDTLSRAETFWNIEPVKDQSTVDPPYYWHEQFVPNEDLPPSAADSMSNDLGGNANGDFNPTLTNLKSMEALPEIAPEDAQIALEEQLARERAIQTFKEEVQEITAAESKSKTMGSISALKKVLAFRNSRNQWQRAGNW